MKVFFHVYQFHFFVGKDFIEYSPYNYFCMDKTFPWCCTLVEDLVLRPAALAGRNSQTLIFLKETCSDLQHSLASRLCQRVGASSVQQRICKVVTDESMLRPSVLSGDAAFAFALQLPLKTSTFQELSKLQWWRHGQAFGPRRGSALCLHMAASFWFPCLSACEDLSLTCT